MTAEAIARWAYLDPIPIELRNQALEALANRSAAEFLAPGTNEYGMHLVYGNLELLESLGILEKAFVTAAIGCRLENQRDYLRIRALLARMNRKKNRAAGDPLPGVGPWKLYRGVAGRGRARRIRGYSWTLQPETAYMFASRFDGVLAHPAVFSAVVPTRHVVFYSNERLEQEFFCDLPRDFPVKRVTITHPK